MRPRNSWRLLAAVAALAVVVGTQAPAQATSSVDDLSAELLGVVQASDFASVVDFEYDTANGPAPQVANAPNVDVAVIRLDADGSPTAAANVLLSRDFPDGLVVDLDDDLAATGIDWRRWDIERWDGDWSAPFPKGSRLVRGTSGETFMSPYPASTFKLLVAFHTLTLVDEGVIRLGETIRYRPTGGDTCLGETQRVVSTTRKQLRDMITFSSNLATCVLLKQLHQLGQVDDMNRGFDALGLPTLEVKGTDAGAGGTWNPGEISMTAMDTARLLLIVNGAPGQLWDDPFGYPVIADRVLTPSSQDRLKALLADQGFNEVLSTTNWCGAGYPMPGLPATVPDRWIDPVDGTVTVDGIPYFQDVRPCNETAEVTFAHKTGLTYNYGSDAGIVEALPGQDGRQYIVAAFANLGYRYSDPSQADSADLPCFTSGVCYTERFAFLGRAIDDFMRIP